MWILVDLKRTPVQLTRIIMMCFSSQGSFKESHADMKNFSNQLDSLFRRYLPLLASLWSSINSLTVWLNSTQHTLKKYLWCVLTSEEKQIIRSHSCTVSEDGPLHHSVFVPACSQAIPELISHDGFISKNSKRAKSKDSSKGLLRKTCTCTHLEGYSNKDNTMHTISQTVALRCSDSSSLFSRL